MFPSQCLFCGHANPAETKFCNDCGAPLHLTLCMQCDAFNELPATNCYKCGAEFPAQLSATDASAAPAAEAALAPSASGEGDNERGHTPLPQRVTEILNVLQRPSGNERAGARARDVDVVTREPRRLARGLTPFFSVERHAAHVISVFQFVATAQRFPIARVALPGLLVAALALSGYYIYRRPQSDVPTEATSRTAPVIAPASDAAGSLVTQGKIRTTGSESVNAETLPHLQVPAAAASQSADTVGVGPRPATPVATESRQKAMRAAGQRVVPKQMPSSRSTATYPKPVAGILMQLRAADTAVRVAPDASRARACTEAVAALGLCNPDTRGESK